MKDELDNLLAFDDANLGGCAGDLTLREALQNWPAPMAPASIDVRVLSAYRNRSRLIRTDSQSLLSLLPGVSSVFSKEVMKMKYCSKCGEEFAAKFNHCAFDGTPLNAYVLDNPLLGDGPRGRGVGVIASTEFSPTILEESGLVSRLAMEIRAVAEESRLTWPEFKRHPVEFFLRTVRIYSLIFWRFISAPNVAIGVVSAMVLLIATVVGVVAYDRYRSRSNDVSVNRPMDLELVEMIPLPTEQPDPKNGAAGLNRGNGGGSGTVNKRPGGGGGGGKEGETRHPSAGKIPMGRLELQIVVADPERPHQRAALLPTLAIVNADPLLIPPDPRDLPFGMRDSSATDPSRGNGTGGGFGGGNGPGAGSGDGAGYGPGRGYNTGGDDPSIGDRGIGGRDGTGGEYDRIYRQPDVHRKAQIIAKPEPNYTEDARKNGTSGTVVLRAVLSSDGHVTSIRVVSGLPYGLTEKAMVAARMIRFVPAMKDNQAVSVYVQLEYNFNLY